MRCPQTPQKIILGSLIVSVSKEFDVEIANVSVYQCREGCTASAAKDQPELQTCTRDCHFRGFDYLGDVNESRASSCNQYVRIG